MVSPLAAELNELLRRDAPRVYGMLSELGQRFYFPKGILTQTAEARQKAHRFNATIGIARENGQAMHLPAVMKHFVGLTPDDVLPYAPSGGRPDLRARWKELIIQKNPSLTGKQFSLPAVTNGITHGLSIVGDMFVDPGDVVLLPDKSWGNYSMVFGVRGGAAIAKYPFFNGTGGLDVQGFRECVFRHASAGKVVVVINFPNNPTGYTATVREAAEIRDALCAVAEQGCDVVAVCDDAYFGLFYEPDAARESLFTDVCDRHENLLAVKLDGATKEDYVWGLRLGFVSFAAKGVGSTVYDALDKKVGGCIRGAISNCPHHTQSIVLKAMQDPAYARQREEKLEVLRRRASRVKEVLAAERFSAVWTPYPFNSGYFMCLKLKGINAELFRLRLLEQYGVGVIATAETDVRVAFSCVEEGDIFGLFEQMLCCAKEMLAEGASNRSVPAGTFEE